MTEPRVPGRQGGELALPCGETVHTHDLDLGMRALACACGDVHAVVMDVHPPERFLPEFLVEVLREAVETTSEEMPEFDTPHVLGIVLEEFPDDVSFADVTEAQDVGYAMVWVTSFDARRLHEIIVELVIELMEHAISHAENDDAVTEFESQMLEFDVGEFVEQYRAQRDFEGEFDRPA